MVIKPYFVTLLLAEAGRLLTHCTSRNSRRDQVVIPLQTSPRWLESTSDQINLASSLPPSAAWQVSQEKGLLASLGHREECSLSSHEEEGLAQAVVFQVLLVQWRGGVATATSARPHSQTSHLQTASQACCSCCPCRLVTVVFILRGHKTPQTSA